MAEEEVEILQSIYGDELVVERSSKNSPTIVLSMKIRSALSQSLCAASIHVVIELPEQYPRISPKIYLRQQRGLDENNANILQKRIYEYTEANMDMPILYDIFQMIQKFVETEQNFPCAVCPVCLDGFSAETSVFCTSNCDHYIHQNCFVRYVNYTEDEIKRELSEWPEDMKSKVDQVLKCPVCRTPLSEQDLSVVDRESITLDEIIGDEEKFEFNWKEWRTKLEELQPIFERQKAKGGLIDPEVERKRYLITDDIVFERRPVAKSSQQKENIEAVECVENLSAGPSYQFLYHQKCKSGRPYSLFRLRNRNMGHRNGPSKEKFRKDRGGNGYIPT
ncbi:RWD domain-containing protein [Loa loa]|uniref:RWD domain-containing protein n=1 Tax=Loa loa TaxID=7209 RepID=A0A1I7VT33_LOALO|nr:RWD domain-containing protein [Loa loa]EFO22202.1 RWD domain-containing protein [Loa loa]